MQTWRMRAAPAAVAPGVTLEVKFSPGIGSAQAFHERVKAMGVHLLDIEVGKAPPPGLQAPYATFGGDPAQPCVFVLWALGPPEQRTTLQIAPKKFTVTAKAKRGHLEPHMPLLVQFLGPPVSVVPAAHARAAAPPRGAAAGTGDIKTALRGHTKPTA